MRSVQLCRASRSIPKRNLERPSVNVYEMFSLKHRDNARPTHLVNKLDRRKAEKKNSTKEHALKPTKHASEGRLNLFNSGLC